MKPIAKNLSLVGILVDHRGDMAPRVQEVITEYGTEVIGRLGVPSPSKEKGLITLAMEAEISEIQEFTGRLKAIEGVEVQIASFEGN